MDSRWQLRVTTPIQLEGVCWSNNLTLELSILMERWDNFDTNIVTLTMFIVSVLTLHSLFYERNSQNLSHLQTVLYITSKLTFMLYFYTSYSVCVYLFSWQDVSSYVSIHFYINNQYLTFILTIWLLTQISQQVMGPVASKGTPFSYVKTKDATY